MSKINKLLNQAELFERLAVFGDRTSFLKSLAQGAGVSDAAVSAAVKAINDALQGWISTHGQRDPAVAGGLMKGLPQSVWQYSTAMTQFGKHQGPFNVTDLQGLYNAARGLAAVATFRDMEQDGKEAWATTVFPAATRLMDLVKKQQDYLASFPKPEPEAAPTNQVASNTQPAAPAKMNLRDAQAWFQKVLQTVNSGKQPSEQDKAQWALNGADFKNRLAQLKRQVGTASDNPYEADGVSPKDKIQNEIDAIQKVVSVLG